MEIEDLLMQIQSYLCQLKVEDLGEIAKTLGSGNSDIKDKNRKGLVRWIEEHLEAELKGSAEEKSEYLEDFKVGIMNYTPHCPLLEDASKKAKPEASQSELAKVKLEYEAVKQKLEAVTAGNLHSPVKEVESKEDVKTKGHRWVAELADFHFTIKYRPGTANQDADALSRMPMDQYMDMCTEEVEPDWIKATVEALGGSE